jgi:quercetin dioxygenase-like cupin family protein
MFPPDQHHARIADELNCSAPLPSAWLSRYRLLKKMKTLHRTLGVLFVVAASAAFFVVRSIGADQPAGFSRKVLQDQDVAVSGHHAVTALIEVAVSGAAARHTHPGEEIGYVIEGTFQLEIDGKPPQVLKAGDTFFVPAGAIHAAHNAGTTPAKVVSTYFLEKGQPLATPAKSP